MTKLAYSFVGSPLIRDPMLRDRRRVSFGETIEPPSETSESPEPAPVEQVVLPSAPPAREPEVIYGRRYVYDTPQYYSNTYDQGVSHVNMFWVMHAVQTLLLLIVICMLIYVSASKK